MNKAGEWLIAFLFVVLIACAGVATVAACVIYATEALGLIEWLFGFSLYVLIQRVFPIAGLLAGVFGVLLIACVILLNRKNPDYTGIAQLGEDISEWLLKYDALYFCVTVAGQIVLLIRFWDVRVAEIKGAVGFVAYLLDAGWPWLILAVALILVNYICKRLSNHN